MSHFKKRNGGNNKIRRKTIAPLRVERPAGAWWSFPNTRSNEIPALYLRISRSGVAAALMHTLFLPFSLFICVEAAKEFLKYRNLYQLYQSIDFVIFVRCNVKLKSFQVAALLFIYLFIYSHEYINIDFSEKKKRKSKTQSLVIMESI